MTDSTEDQTAPESSTDAILREISDPRRFSGTAPRNVPDPSSFDDSPYRPAPVRLATLTTETAALLSSINAQISQRADAIRSQGADELRAMPEVTSLPEQATHVRKLLEAYGREVAAINANRGLNREGRQTAIEDAQIRLDSALEKAMAPISQSFDAIAKARTERALQPPPADVAPGISLILTRSQVQSAEGTIEEAVDTLRRASDPATPPEEQFRLNLELKHGFRPVLDRFVRSPQPWAKSSQGMASEVQFAIDRHLANAQLTERSAQARRLIDAAKQDLAWAIGEVKRTGSWDRDSVIPTGTRLLFKGN